MLGKSFVVKDPQPGVDPSLRSIVALGKELATDDSVVGNPIDNGAVVEIIAHGTISTDQVFVIPAGLSVSGSPGWKALGNPVIGYSYKDAPGTHGPVKTILIKKAGNATFIVKAVIKGALGPGPQPHITVVPPQPGTNGGMRFTIGGGDTYCVNFGGSAGGAIANSPSSPPQNKVFKVVSKPTSPTNETAGCPTSASDLGDGTILDTRTNLQWEKKDTVVGSGANAADLHDVDNRYSWAGQCTINTSVYCQPNAAAAATCAAQSSGGTFGCGQCGGGDGLCNVDPFALGAITTVWDWLNGVNAANFAGHSDWRLPSEEGQNTSPSTNPRELETILLAPYPCGTPCIASTFGPTAVSNYWSASTLAVFPVAAWSVGFVAGNVSVANKPADGSVRAVR